jgi:hypothetical protein
LSPPTYNAIHYGQENGITSRKGMKEFYWGLKGVELPSCYKVAVITRACLLEPNSWLQEGSAENDAQYAFNH